MMLFLGDVRVKVNRKILLCKRSGGEREICKVEEPFSKAPVHGGREGVREDLVVVAAPGLLLLRSS
jgi:hypothetical protein